MAEQWNVALEDSKIVWLLGLLAILGATVNWKILCDMIEKYQHYLHSTLM